MPALEICDGELGRGDLGCGDDPVQASCASCGLSWSGHVLRSSAMAARTFPAQSVMTAATTALTTGRRIGSHQRMGMAGLKSRPFQ